MFSFLVWSLIAGTMGVKCLPQFGRESTWWNTSDRSSSAIVNILSWAINVAIDRAIRSDRSRARSTVASLRSIDWSSVAISIVASVSILLREDDVALLMILATAWSCWRRCSIRTIFTSNSKKSGEWVSICSLANVALLLSTIGSYWREDCRSHVILDLSWSRWWGARRSREDVAWFTAWWLRDSSVCHVSALNWSFFQMVWHTNRNANLGLDTWAGAKNDWLSKWQQQDRTQRWIFLVCEIKRCSVCVRWQNETKFTWCAAHNNVRMTAMNTKYLIESCCCCYANANLVESKALLSSAISCALLWPINYHTDFEWAKLFIGFVR